MKEKWALLAGDFKSPYLRNRLWTDLVLVWHKEIKLPWPYLGIISRDNEIKYITKMSSWKGMAQVFMDQIGGDLDKFDKIIDRSLKTGKTMNGYTEDLLKKDLQKWSNQKLIQAYKKFTKLQARTYAHGGLLVLLDIGGVSYLEGELKNILQEKLGTKDHQKYYDVFTYPLKDSFAQEQENSWLEIYQEIYQKKKLLKILKEKPAKYFLSVLQQEHKKIYQKVKRRTSKYAWVFYVYQGPAYTEEDFVEFLKEYAHKNIQPKKELAKRKKYRQEIDRKKKDYTQKLKLNSRQKKIAYLAGKVVWAKPRRKDLQSKSYYHMEKVVGEIGSRLGLSLREVRSAPIEKLEKWLKGKKVDKKYLKEIERLHVVVPGKNKKIYFYSGAKAKEFIKNNVKKEPASANTASGKEVKGVCACLGPKIKGRVKIINRTEDMVKMKEGDVLVSMATTPAIVGAMKKASAFVTDEGGLTCHAAIVSREMQKPCIVGTKIATKILKDGDRVEVDSKKGIVKKI